MTAPPPLDGVRVVDFGQLIAAPNATMILAELGATVIKVEPHRGDAGRELQSAAFAGSSTSPTFLAFNRNKRSVALDLRTDGGVEVARALIAEADIVVESSRPGVMDRLGLGATAVRAERPEVIYASVSGFGDIGPQRDRRGVDMAVQAESGIMSVTGEADGAPLKVGFTVVDVVAGNVVAQAVLAALLRRATTGVGDTIHVSLLEVALHLQAAPMSEFLATGVTPPRTGNSAPMTAPADLFPTRDGHVVVSAYLDAHWTKLCEVIGRPDLADHPDYATKVLRVANRDALTAELSAVLRTRTTDEWLAVLGETGLVVGAVHAYPEVVAAPQVEALGAIVEIPDGAGATYRTVRLPARYTSWTPSDPLPPPGIGEHTDEVLRQHGYSAERIDELRRSGAIAGSPSRDEFPTTQSPGTVPPESGPRGAVRPEFDPPETVQGA